jgi:hypothetical protein
MQQFLFTGRSHQDAPLVNSLYFLHGHVLCFRHTERHKNSENKQQKRKYKERIDADRLLYERKTNHHNKIGEP